MFKYDCKTRVDVRSKKRILHKCKTRVSDKGRTRILHLIMQCINDVFLSDLNTFLILNVDTVIALYKFMNLIASKYCLYVPKIAASECG